MPRLAIHTVVMHQRGTVDAPAFLIQGAGLIGRQRTGNDRCANHTVDCLSMYFLMISLLTFPAVLRKYERVHKEGSFNR